MEQVLGLSFGLGAGLVLLTVGVGLGIFKMPIPATVLCLLGLVFTIVSSKMILAHPLMSKKPPA